MNHATQAANHQAMARTQVADRTVGLLVREEAAKWVSKLVGEQNTNNASSEWEGVGGKQHFTIGRL